MARITPPYELPLLRNPVPTVQRTRFGEEVRANRFQAVRSANFSPNPGAEVDISWWLPYNATTTVTRDTGTKRSGAASFKMTKSGGGSTVTGLKSPLIPTRPGEMWNITGWILEGSYSGPVETDIDFFDSTGSPVGTNIPQLDIIALEATWKEMNDDVWRPAPSGATHAQLTITSDNAMADGGTWFVDDLSVTRIGAVVAQGLATGDTGSRFYAEKPSSFALLQAEDATDANLARLRWDTDNLYLENGQAPYLRLQRVYDQTTDRRAVLSAGSALLVVGGDLTNPVTGAAWLEGSGDIDIVAGDDLRLSFQNLFLNGTEALVGAWTAFTPTITQSAAISKTMTNSRYCRIGRLVVWSGRANLTSAGTAGNAVLMTLPVNVQGTGMACGYFVYFDQSSGIRYSGLLLANAATNVLLVWGEDQTGTNAFGADPAVTVANLDALDFFLMYEAAS